MTFRMMIDGTTDVIILKDDALQMQKQQRYSEGTAES